MTDYIGKKVGLLQPMLHRPAAIGCSVNLVQLAVVAAAADFFSDDGEVGL
jgi:hypothetical protein